MSYELSDYDRVLVEQTMYLYYLLKGCGRRVLRQGWNLWGIANHLFPKFCEPNRLEYVAEHEQSSVVLAFLLFGQFPEYFYGIKRDEVYELLSVHDTGEIVTGDMPDDGNRDEARKDKEELDFLEWLFRRKNPYGRNIPSFDRLLENFKCFQQKSTIATRFAYCIDKTDAILQGLVYEYDGFPGNINYKKARGVLSSRDREVMKITNSLALVDNWAESCRPNLERSDPTGAINFFSNFIKIAIAYVRSDEFNPKEDIKLYCKEHDLPAPDWCR